VQRAGIVDELAAPKPTPQTGGVVLAIQFAPDSQSMLIGLNGGLHVWTPGGTEASRTTQGRVLFPQMFVTDGTTAMLSSASDDAITRTNIVPATSFRPCLLAMQLQEDLYRTSHSSGRWSQAGGNSYLE